MSISSQERILSIAHWSERLVSFTTTRSSLLDSSPALTVPLGDEGVVTHSINDQRAGSRTLEFLHLDVAGARSRNLARQLDVGDTVTVHASAAGPALERLLPGRRLHVLAADDGIAAGLQAAFHAQAGARYEQVVLIHEVARIDRVAFHDLIQQRLLGSAVDVGYHCVVREPFDRGAGLVERLLRDEASQALRIAPLDSRLDRVLAFATAPVIHDGRRALAAHGFSEASDARSGSFLVAAIPGQATSTRPGLQRERRVA
ncbi:ferredoxin--NADP reductase [soil metagenome]